VQKLRGEWTRQRAPNSRVRPPPTSSPAPEPPDHVIRSRPPDLLRSLGPRRRHSGLPWLRAVVASGDTRPTGSPNKPALDRLALHGVGGMSIDIGS